MPGAGEGRAFSAAAAAAAVAKEERKWGAESESFVKGFEGSEEEAIIEEATRRQGKVCGDVDKVR